MKINVFKLSILMDSPTLDTSKIQPDKVLGQLDHALSRKVGLDDP